MATYVVTGGAGFIGSNLSEALLKARHTVHILDNLSGGKRENIPNDAVFHEIDITNYQKLQDTLTAIDSIDGIFHLAALPRVEFSIQHPLEAHAANVDGTLNVLKAAKEAGNVKVVFSSSSSAYGEPDTMPTTEMEKICPKSPYALHKVIGEQYCKMFGIVYGMPTVCLRYFNVFGPKCDPNGPYALVIGKFIKMRIDGKPMTITGDGTQTRDAVHVSDVVRANMLAMEKELPYGEIINIGSGVNRTMNSLAELIGGPIEYIAPRLEPHDTLADISKAEELLGWKPLKTFEDGLKELKEEMGLA